MKKIITLFLALTMVFSCATPTLAADDYLQSLADKVKSEYSNYDIDWFPQIIDSNQTADYLGHGVISIDGNTLAHLDGSSYTIPEGLEIRNAYGEIPETNEAKSIVYKQGIKCGLMSLTGVKITEPIYSNITPIRDTAYFVVRTEDYYYGIIDENGKEIIPISLQYDFLDINGTNLDYIIASKKDKYGFVNISGKVVVPLIYERVDHFSEGLAAVSKDGSGYYINQQGKTVISLGYDIFGYDFSEGLAGFIDCNQGLMGMCGYINKQGKTVIPAIYMMVQPFHDGRAIVSEDTQIYGVIDTTGKTILPATTYDQIYDYCNGYAYTRKHAPYQGHDSHFIGIIDTSGKVVYDNIFVDLDWEMQDASKPYPYQTAPDIPSQWGDKPWIGYLDSNFNVVFDFEKYGEHGDLQQFHNNEAFIKLILIEKISTTKYPRGYGYLCGILHYNNNQTSTSTPPVTPNGFTDVPSNAWYAQDIIDVQELGIIQGKGNGLFDPEGTLTISQAITLAAKTRAHFNGDTVPTVSGGTWYDGAVAYAKEQGIISGLEFANYDKAATRAEMAFLFAHALPDSEYKPINNVTELPDVNDNTKYSEEILKLYNAGILSGSDKYGTFETNNQITRAQATAILNRLVNADNRKVLNLD